MSPVLKGDLKGGTAVMNELLGSSEYTDWRVRARPNEVLKSKKRRNPGLEHTAVGKPGGMKVWKGRDSEGAPESLPIQAEGPSPEPGLGSLASLPIAPQALSSLNRYLRGGLHSEEWPPEGSSCRDLGCPLLPGQGGRGWEIGQSLALLGPGAGGRPQR